MLALHTISLNNKKIAYTDSASNSDVLLFIHGMGCTSSFWNTMILTLRKDYRCIAIDLPGYGDSEKLSEFNLLEVSELIQKFIFKLRLNEQNIHLVGHSMGAQISIILGIRYANLFQSLTLIAPAGIETFDEKEKSLILKSIGMLPSPIMRESTLAMVSEPTSAYLSSLSLPSLILFGTADNMIPNPLKKGVKTKDIANDAAMLIPNAKLVLMPFKGHFLPLEASNECISSILDFLKK